jgi:hypothetical protein
VIAVTACAPNPYYEVSTFNSFREEAAMLTRRYAFWAGASALALFLANRFLGLGSVSQASETF